MSENPEVIIIRETTAESLIADAGTFVTVFGLTAIGWYLGITALEWIGSIMAMLAIASRAMASEKRLTIAQARKRLDELERGA